MVHSKGHRDFGVTGGPLVHSTLGHRGFGAVNLNLVTGGPLVQSAELRGRALNPDPVTSSPMLLTGSRACFLHLMKAEKVETRDVNLCPYALSLLVCE